MKRLLGIVAGLVVVAILVTLAVGRLLPSQPVYSVADVQIGLQQHPSQWIGRTILVRGSVATSSGFTVCSVRFGRSRSVSSRSCRQIATIGIVPPTLSISPAAGPAYSSSVSTALAIIQARVGGAIRPVGVGRGPLALLMRGSFVTTQPSLDVAIGTGVRIPAAAGSHRSLPDFLYNLPLVGQRLSEWFPTDSGAIFRVRLKGSPSCSSPGASVTCDGTDGMLLAP